MRPLPLLPFLLALAATPAVAQVSVNNQALDSLGQSSGGSTTHRTAPRHPAPAHRPAPPARHPAPAAREPARPAAPAVPANPPPAAHAIAPHVSPAPSVRTPPAIPAAPPPNAAIAPATPASPAHPAAPPPPPVPVVNAAQGETATISGGVRVTFGANTADLNAATMTAVQKFAALVKDQPIGIDVIATAAGSAEDPSTPRRISLSRALAVRAVLINEGIPSTRIYPRALGPNVGDGPPDRVDLVEHKVTPSPDTEPKQ